MCERFSPMSTRGASRTNSLRRLAADRLGRAAQPLPALLFSNRTQFNQLEADTALVLYYRESSDGQDVIFDPNGDARLLAMHRKPFQFQSSADLPLLIALRTRARYELRIHPNQAGILQAAVADRSIDTTDCIALVYARDDDQRSIVKNRRVAPFANDFNGLRADGTGESAELVLFRQYSFEPFGKAVIVWSRQKSVNATVGVLLARVQAVADA